ncbi:MAG: hypothetical protein EXQ58_10260 [Acidobacteria bacterium]|nr:hypothetical protein [Acidobacteriota bacterium]
MDSESPSTPIATGLLEVIVSSLEDALEADQGGPDEVEDLLQQAEDLAALGITGLVLGFLRQGQVDVAVIRRSLSRAPNLKATFHRAFDERAYPLAEIGRLKDLDQVDRILTTGGGGPWKTRAKRLERYQQAAEPEITILGGGGLDRVGVKRLLSETGLREFHTGRTVRVPEESFGKVHPQKVRQLVAYLRP